APVPPCRISPARNSMHKPEAQAKDFRERGGCDALALDGPRQESPPCRIHLGSAIGSGSYGAESENVEITQRQIAAAISTLCAVDQGSQLATRYAGARNG